MRRLDQPPRFRTRRRFDYERRLLPNAYLAQLEPEGIEDPRIAARLFTGRTIGYPAWNLLYYSLLCSLPGPDPDEPSLLPNPLRNDCVVIETGTNRGASTLIMAQALKDVNLDAVVQTVDLNEDILVYAKGNAYLAGLEDRIVFNHGDSIEFLRSKVEEVSHIDFIFLDDDHDGDHMFEEFSIVRSKLLARGGTAYFDNTLEGGVAEALNKIKEEFGGNLLRFDNCSWGPPGNAIWQPDRPFQT
jgi:O-methyltransferase